VYPLKISDLDAKISDIKYPRKIAERKFLKERKIAERNP